MKNIKRVFAICLVAAMILALVPGCSDKGERAGEDVTISIVIHPLLVGVEDALIEQFPDIKFNFEIYCGVNYSEYLRQKVLNDDAGDIIFSTLKFTDDLQRASFIDLSGYGFTGNYNINTLNMFSIEGSVYMLPGPLELRCMAYNKTMFEEYGWELPNNHAELVELVHRIREESDVTPITFAGSGLGFYFTTMTTLAQSGFLSTPEGSEWEKKYLAGEVSCEQGFSEGIALLQDLIDADAYDIDEDENYWAGDAIQKFVVDQNAAMMAVWSNQALLGESVSESDAEFALFPFYGVEEESSFIGTNCSTQLALSKNLEKEGNEAKLEAALRIMEWLSTPEGMSHIKHGNADVLPLNEGNPETPQTLYQEVWQLNLDGHKASMLYSGYEDIIIQTSEYIREAMRNNTSLDGLIPLIDELHREALETPEEAGICVVEERFDAQQTAQLQANILYETGLGDFALISLGDYKNGIKNNSGSNGILYEGILETSCRNVIIPARNGIETVTLSGADIKIALEQGKHMINEETGNEAYFEYFWSGLDVEMNNGEVVSIKINGEEMDEEKTYTAVLPLRDHSVEMESVGVINETDLVYQDIYLDYMTRNSPITAPEVMKAP